MKKENFIIVETTCSNMSLAKKLAKILLEEKLAACIHLQKMISLYFWEEKLENDQEVLLSIKTKNSKFLRIEKTIKKHHEYKLPQIIAIPIIKGSKDYLSWIDTNLQGKNK